MNECKLKHKKSSKTKQNKIKTPTYYYTFPLDRKNCTLRKVISNQLFASIAINNTSCEQSYGTILCKRTSPNLIFHPHFPRSMVLYDNKQTHGLG